LSSRPAYFNYPCVLELELLQTQMTQKPMLRVEVQRRACPGPSIWGAHGGPAFLDRQPPVPELRPAPHDGGGLRPRNHVDLVWRAAQRHGRVSSTVSFTAGQLRRNAWTNVLPAMGLKVRKSPHHRLRGGSRVLPGPKAGDDPSFRPFDTVHGV
jgi:hypothetical protein